MIRLLESRIVSHLGVCGRCARQSFSAALVAVIAMTVSWLVFGASLLTAAVAVIALALALLWVAHVVTYSARVATKARAATPLRNPSRRAFFPTFAKIAAAAALATALPYAVAHADPACPDGEWCCKHDFSQQGNPCVQCCQK